MLGINDSQFLAPQLGGRFSQTLKQNLERITIMTYAMLNLVYTWCVEQFVANSTKDGKPTVSMEYLEALEELAKALKKVMKFN